MDDYEHYETPKGAEEAFKKDREDSIKNLGEHQLAGPIKHILNTLADQKKINKEHSESEKKALDLLNDLTGNVNRLVTALSGDPKMGHVGITERVARNDEEIIKLKDDSKEIRARFKGAIWIMGLVTAIIAFLSNISAFFGPHK